MRFKRSGLNIERSSTLSTKTVQKHRSWTHSISKMAVFWVVAPCSLVDVYQRFRGPCCLHPRRRENLKSYAFSFVQTLLANVVRFGLRAPLQVIVLIWTLLSEHASGRLSVHASTYLLYIDLLKSRSNAWLTDYLAVTYQSLEFFLRKRRQALSAMAPPQGSRLQEQATCCANCLIIKS
jgi:hypothetical protein